MSDRNLESEKKEDLKKQKQKEVDILKAQKKEDKKIDKLVTKPFVVLFNLGALLSVISFVVFFFGSGHNPVNSLYYAFLIFCSVFVGIGLVLILLYFIKANNQKLKKEHEDFELNNKNNIDDDELDKLLENVGESEN